MRKLFVGNMNVISTKESVEEYFQNVRIWLFAAQPILTETVYNVQHLYNPHHLHFLNPLYTLQVLPADPLCAVR